MWLAFQAVEVTSHLDFELVVFVDLGATSACEDYELCMVS